MARTQPSKKIDMRSTLLNAADKIGGFFKGINDKAVKATEIPQLEPRLKKFREKMIKPRKKEG